MKEESADKQIHRLVARRFCFVFHDSCLFFCRAHITMVTHITLVYNLPWWYCTCFCITASSAADAQLLLSPLVVPTFAFTLCAYYILKCEVQLVIEIYNPKVYSKDTQRFICGANSKKQRKCWYWTMLLIIMRKMLHCEKWSNLKSLQIQFKGR